MTDLKEIHVHPDVHSVNSTRVLDNSVIGTVKYKKDIMIEAAVARKSGDGYDVMELYLTDEQARELINQLGKTLLSNEENKAELESVPAY